MPLLDAERYAIQRVRKQRRRRLMTCLAAIVVFVTTYALILPAITMTRQCQIPEHQHTDTCYTVLDPIVVTVPVCNEDTLNIHHHTSSCYDQYGQPVCGYADFVVHEHDSSCYDKSGHMWCTIPEVKYHIHDSGCYPPYEPQPTHQHGEGCYEYVQGNLICGMEVDEGHVHIGTCYDELGQPICGEGERPSHSHDDTCYEYIETLVCEIPLEPQADETTQPAPICGKTETVLHQHGATCFDLTAQAIGGMHYNSWSDASPVSTGEQPICGMPQLVEHQHSSACCETRLEAPDGAQLICTNTDPDHIHDYYCYDCRVLICGMEAHKHNEDCTPSQEQQYYCGKDVHIHVATCFDADGNSICGMQGHVHNDDCLIPPAESTPEPEPEPSESPEPEPEPSESPEPEPEPSESPEPEPEPSESPEPEPEPSESPEPEPEPSESPEPEPEPSESPEPEPEPSESPEPEPEEPPIEEPEEPDVPPTEFPTYCGFEEHKHVATCFDADGNPICGLEEHRHNDECYIPQTEEEKVPLCGLEEHKHVATCFDADGNPICTLEEHTHTEQCYLTEKERLAAILEQFTAEVEALEALDSLTDQDKETANDLLARLDEAHEQGQLADDAYTNLCDRINALLILDQLTQEVNALENAETFDEQAQETAKALLAKLDEAHNNGQLADENYRSLYSRVNVLLFTQEVEALESLETLTDQDEETANDLLARLDEAHRLGQLTDEAFTDLYNRVSALLVDESDVMAEPAYGTNWILLRDSGWFEEYSDCGINLMAQNDSDSVVFTLATGTVDENTSDQQVNNWGGTNTNSTDGVSVRKIIDGTDIENVFDITLTVETPQNIGEVLKEPDMAVVIVMDISNTMTNDFGGVTRYAAAMEAAENFLDSFAANNTLGVSKIGYVAFNTDAHKIFGLQACTNETQANALKNTMRTSTGSIINASGYAASHNRFTNVEAGLKRANDMLSGVSNKNKFIVFLSDGFPTTYIESDYKGYDPYATDSPFFDYVLNKPCSSGTSYSDAAAIKAREMATSIKSSGTTIFSIGVDVGGQTIQKYIKQSEGLSGISVVDRTGTTYEIGDENSAESYKTWLRNSIGSGYYYDSTNTAGLKAAYDDIFAQIKTTVEAAAAADWVASDPIPSITPDEIEFIGLYDKEDQLQGVSLAGSHAENAENTAEYKQVNESDKNKAIQWDLKSSGYTTSTSGGTTLYSYKLKYRVRLKNEDTAFVEDRIYNTNGETTLQYRVVQNVNGSTAMSESKTIEFPIPSVCGYLGELTFVKKDSRGSPLAGAEFTLTHDATCHVCHGDGTPVTVASITATSGDDGTVSFANIPSGHTYTLTETKIPDGYTANGNCYTVTVAYDNTTVKVTASDKKTEVQWDGTIVNNAYYALPNTGGSGTTLYTALGLLLIAAAIGGLYSILHRKEEHETS